jgi:translation elongation factor EF-Tu-like GTPase
MFRMTVQDVFVIRGRAVVANGRVENQKLRAGDHVHGSRDVRVDGIEAFRKVPDVAQTGDNIGVLLPGLDRSEISAGDPISPTIKL